MSISWLPPSEATDTYFIVLPNATGQVLGIDEMFGNKTVGPDGEMANNGFAALQKFDGRNEDGSIVAERKNGIIDAQDPVFNRLRLWHDLNGNGVAEPDELLRMDAVGVTSIDLNAQEFSETDAYGNSLKMRSVASLHDGSFRLVFDLWFALP